MKESEAAKLQAYLRRWRIGHPYRWQQGAAVVANDLLQDAAFTDIKLASLLESPGGATTANVVESVVPFPASAEAEGMVKAIEIAANQQTAKQVVGVLAVGVLAALLLWGLFGSS